MTAGPSGCSRPRRAVRARRRTPPPQLRPRPVAEPSGRASACHWRRPNGGDGAWLARLSHRAIGRSAEPDGQRSIRAGATHHVRRGRVLPAQHPADLNRAIASGAVRRLVLLECGRPADAYLSTSSTRSTAAAVLDSLDGGRHAGSVPCPGATATTWHVLADSRTLAPFGVSHDRNQRNLCARPDRTSHLLSRHYGRPGLRPQPQPEAFAFALYELLAAAESG